MKGGPGSGTMQETFGCVAANRFHQLLDDESDPFDVLREAERRRQLQLPRRKRDEAGATAQGPKAGGAGGRKGSRKERKGPVAPASPGGALPPPPLQSLQGTEVTLSRPHFRTVG